MRGQVDTDTGNCLAKRALPPLGLSFCLCIDQQLPLLINFTSLLILPLFPKPPSSLRIRNAQLGDSPPTLINQQKLRSHGH